MPPRRRQRANGPAGGAAAAQAAPLLALPPDVFDLIGQGLTMQDKLNNIASCVRDVASLAQTCKTLRQLAGSTLWVGLGESVPAVGAATASKLPGIANTHKWEGQFLSHRPRKLGTDPKPKVLATAYAEDVPDFVPAHIFAEAARLRNLGLAGTNAKEEFLLTDGELKELTRTDRSRRGADPMTVKCDSDAHADAAQLAAKTLLLAMARATRGSPAPPGTQHPASPPVPLLTEAPRSHSSPASSPLAREQCSTLSDGSQLPSTWASFLASVHGDRPAGSQGLPPPLAPARNPSPVLAAIDDACRAAGRQIIKPTAQRPVSAAAAAIKCRLEEARLRRGHAQAASAQHRQEQLQARRLVAQAQGRQLRQALLQQRAQLVAAAAAAMPPPPARPAQPPAADLNLLISQLVVGLRDAVSAARSALEAQVAHRQRQALEWR
ncbi:hypothetical protein C2E20_8199 [Micractinium conductrix]|uniref:Uncharacterized protein n=1 Tax=Micractinium conductrix TaxID=554055 RepID=A0A2P6V284_9CHLO|nr:hypothetical protein C2E20_8199 [Micractinium conductrix]|eukprot:PSC68205.1 hypothetical protein C2E20_8199 [Micractinium conductrix]